MKRVAFSVAGLLALCCALPAYADDTIVADHGKSVSPQVSNDISMTEETVEISVHDLVDKKRSVFPLRMAHVKCLFTFSNSTNKTIEASVGFPGDIPAYGDYSQPLSDFVTVIDGQPRTVSVREEHIAGPTESSYQSLRHWYTWTMTFPPRSVVKVENRYLHELSAPPGYDPFYLTYEMSTGANWRGPIGKATIRIIYDSVSEMEARVCGIEPSRWAREGNAIVWQFQNLEPTIKDNIRVCERNLGIENPEKERKPLLFK